MGRIAPLLQTCIVNECGHSHMPYDGSRDPGLVPLKVTNIGISLSSTTPFISNVGFLSLSI